MNSIEHFIDGKITKGLSKRTSKVFNPATGEQSAEVNLASKADVDLAVKKATKARKDGLLALEADLSTMEDGFFKNGIELRKVNVDRPRIAQKT